MLYCSLSATQGFDSQPFARPLVAPAEGVVSSTTPRPATERSSSPTNVDRRHLTLASAPLPSSTLNQSVEDSHDRPQTGGNNGAGPSADRPNSDIPPPPPHTDLTANTLVLQDRLTGSLSIVHIRKYDTDTYSHHDSGESEVDMDEVDDSVPVGNTTRPDWETSESLTCLFCNHAPFLRGGDCRRHMRERCPNNPAARKGAHVCQFCQNLIKGPLSDLRGHWNYCQVRVRQRLPIPNKPEKPAQGMTGFLFNSRTRSRKRTDSLRYLFLLIAPPPPPTSFVFDQVVTPSMYTEPAPPPPVEEEPFYEPRFPPSPTYGPPNRPRSVSPPAKRRGSKARPGHIPRPPNAFMLFRSHCIHTDRVTDTQANLSRAIGAYSHNRI